MGDLKLTMVTKNYDYLAPLACRDVSPEGIDLVLIRDTKGALDRVQNDPTVDGGEVSFSRTVIDLARGDRQWVLLPVFVNRGFQLRHFYVLRDSGIRTLEDLRGKRVGLEYWATSGSTWCRAAVRERGVALQEISWFVGPLDGAAPPQPRGDLPSFAHLVPPGRGLQEMLLKRELDAAICWHRPPGFYEPGSALVRLFPDFRLAEREYFIRMGFCPGYHLIRLRREIAERDPWAVGSVFSAFDRSMALSREERRSLSETTPWLLSEIEDVVSLFGEDWWPNGVDPNREMMRTFCQEQFVQGLTPSLVDVADIFADFDAICGPLALAGRA